MDEIAFLNRDAWNEQVKLGNRWTVPVTAETVAAARRGDWEVVLTPQRSVPKAWFPDLVDASVLCLASGGGQQGPLLAAAGANVTVFDNSPLQLEQDQSVARRDELPIKTILGDMRDLSALASESFDLVFLPCSVSFVPEVQPVFDEVHRVLCRKGRFMAGFTQPFRFLFDEFELEAGALHVRHRLPFSDRTHLTAQEQAKLQSANEPAMFSHSLENLIGGQITAGFVIRGLFEDHSGDALSQYSPDYFATLAEKASG